MTSTELRMPSDLLKKYGAEIMPSVAYKRDERIRSVASSFENIAESEEEEEDQVEMASSSNRSPYAQPQSPFAQRRSSSLTRNTHSSPALLKRSSPPRLTRGYSDPLIIRKSSFSLFNDSIPIRKTSDTGCDILSPIPEAASPLQSPAFGLFLNKQ